jgi:uncharacterized membrane protein YccF (DUF307 family)
MRILGNIIWLLFGGIVTALGYLLAGLIMCLLIVTIPFGIQAFKLASFSFWPFGRTLVPKQGAGAVSFLGNIIWFIFAGWWLAISHLVSALLCAITIIGIPFAVAHLKLAGTAIAPFGSEIVPLSQARAGEAIVAIGSPTDRGDGPNRPLPPG